jgi:hypothetical protein
MQEIAALKNPWDIDVVTKQQLGIQLVLRKIFFPIGLNSYLHYNQIYE